MKKKFIINIICLSACFLLTCPHLVFGHGVKVTMETKSPFIIVGAGYHGGKALGDADVTIRFDTDETKFQTGTTDKNGNFCFYPDRPGKWTASVDDGMGHRGKKDILLEETFFNPPTAPVTEDLSKEIKDVKENKEKEDKAKEDKAKKDKAKKEEKKENKIPLSQNDMCCYLLKIVLGVVLILVITLILHRWKKKMERGSHIEK